MTNRQHLDALVDGNFKDIDFISATTTTPQAKVAAKTALSAMHLLADAIDGLSRRFDLLDTPDHSLEIDRLVAEVAELREQLGKLQKLATTGKKKGK
jgi:hypothetical protein